MKQFVISFNRNEADKSKTNNNVYKLNDVGITAFINFMMSIDPGGDNIEPARPTETAA